MALRRIASSAYKAGILQYSDTAPLEWSHSGHGTIKVGQLARPFCRPIGNRPPSKDRFDDTAILAEIESELA